MDRDIRWGIDLDIDRDIDWYSDRDIDWDIDWDSGLEIYQNIEQHDELMTMRMSETVILLWRLQWAADATIRSWLFSSLSLSLSVKQFQNSF